MTESKKKTIMTIRTSESQESALTIVLGVWQSKEIFLKHAFALKFIKVRQYVSYWRTHINYSKWVTLSRRVYLWMWFFKKEIYKKSISHLYLLVSLHCCPQPWAAPGLLLTPKHACVVYSVGVWWMYGWMHLVQRAFCPEWRIGGRAAEMQGVVREGEDS